MENLDLRKAVAEANGCKPYTSVVGFLCCGCKDYAHAFKIASSAAIPFYELDHHAAQDALMEFCEKNDCRWELEDRRDSVAARDRYLCRIIKSNMLCVTEHADLVKAICFNIQRAAQKSEKKEAGE